MDWTLSDILYPLELLPVSNNSHIRTDFRFPFLMSEPHIGKSQGHAVSLDCYTTNVYPEPARRS